MIPRMGDLRFTYRGLFRRPACASNRTPPVSSSRPTALDFQRYIFPVWFACAPGAWDYASNATYADLPRPFPWGRFECTAPSRPSLMMGRDHRYFGRVQITASIDYRDRK